MPYCSVGTMPLLMVRANAIQRVTISCLILSVFISGLQLCCYVEGVEMEFPVVASPQLARILVNPVSFRCRLCLFQVTVFCC